MNSFVISTMPRASTDQLHIIILDQRIGEELVGRLLERDLGLSAVAAFDLDVEDLALAHADDAVHAEGFQRPLDGLALRIENAGFERDGDASFHRRSFGRHIGYAHDSITPQAPSKGLPPLELARESAFASAADRRSAGRSPAASDPVQLLTRTGPLPCGRSPSFMMPRRLATSV